MYYGYGDDGVIYTSTNTVIIIGDWVWLYVLVVLSVAITTYHSYDKLLVVIFTFLVPSTSHQDGREYVHIVCNAQLSLPKPESSPVRFHNYSTGKVFLSWLSFTSIL